MKFSTRFCTVVAATISAVGLYFLLAWPGEPSPGQAITVVEPDRDLGELARGDHAVTFRIANASSLPLRVIGIKES